jgi:hypothetical protein
VSIIRATVIVVATAIALALGAFWLSATLTAATPGGTPKLDVGKHYDAVYSCQRQLVVVSDGIANADTCYIELWTVLEVGKDGWVRIRDEKSGDEWYGNLNRLSAIREHVEPRIEPTTGQLKIQANGSYSGTFRVCISGRPETCPPLFGVVNVEPAAAPKLQATR